MTAAAESDIPLAFDHSFDGKPGELIRLSPLVRRMVAGNAGPMTFTGTCAYVVGAGKVAIIDPGPDKTDHITALLDALRNETITAILVTHTHKDHAPGARALKDATGARIYGCPPCAPASLSGPGVTLRLDAAHDLDHAPDMVMQDGDTVEFEGFTLVCVETPGHTQNHLAFALPEEGALFSGDHVMAWSTSVVAPPDGKMQDYMASLKKLRERDDRIYWPGHGGPVREPGRFVRALAQHRKFREKAILASLRKGATSIDAIVADAYDGLDPMLRVAAAFSTLAHLEKLVAENLVVTEGPPGLESRYHPL
jgi:glyoxylase-like metal-dependent hydrolase (beta-lactamase superfamily II)